MELELDKGVLFPSPNWFQSSGMKVTNDGWVVYGGPAKSLCVLMPLPANCNVDNIIGNAEESSYHAHVVQKAHSEK